MAEYYKGRKLQAIDNSLEEKRKFRHIKDMQRICFPAFIASLIMLLFVAQVAPRNLKNIFNLGNQAPVEIVEEEVKEKSITEHKYVFSTFCFQLNLSFPIPSELSPQTHQTPFLKPPRHA